MRRNRLIVRLRAELVPALFVNRIDDLLAVTYGNPFRSGNLVRAKIAL